MDNIRKLLKLVEELYELEKKHKLKYTDKIIYQWGSAWPTRQGGKKNWEARHSYLKRKAWLMGSIRTIVLEMT
jgi:hypothetical protein